MSIAGGEIACQITLSDGTHSGRRPSYMMLKALYLSTFEATKKWTMPIRNWGQVYGELSIMYEGRLPE